MTWKEVADEIEAALPEIFAKMHQARIAGDFVLGNWLEQEGAVFMWHLAQARYMQHVEEEEKR